MESIAADVGVDVLKGGGDAVDAAIAVGFAMAATHPFAGNLAGGGYMLIRLADGRTTFIDFREKAPAKASPAMYLDVSGNPTRESLEGWRSAGVPGTVSGFAVAQAKHGIETDLPEGRRVLRNLFGLVQGEANAIQPAKRPVSSMLPTIILKDGRLFMTAGAPGGSRIPTTRQAWCRRR